MKQTNVSKWMKGITIAMAVMGIVFFAVMVPYIAKAYLDTHEGLEALWIPMLIFDGVTGVFCYTILFQFWKVCIQIDNENTFSKENEIAFGKMGTILLLLALIWVAGLIGLFAGGIANGELICMMLVLIFIWVVIAGMCKALSKLIEKASEIREENDLTI